MNDYMKTLAKDYDERPRTWVVAFFIAVTVFLQVNSILTIFGLTDSVATSDIIVAFVTLILTAAAQSFLTPTIVAYFGWKVVERLKLAPEAVSEQDQE